MKRKTAILAISYLSCAAVFLGGVAIYQDHRAEQYEMYLAENYQHAFEELVSGIEEIDTALRKSLYAMSPAMISATNTEVFAKAMTAQMALGVLPFSTQELESTAAFISRVGDYASALAHDAGRGYTQEETDGLRSLADTADLLAQNLRQLRLDLVEGRLEMDSMVQAEYLLDDTAEELVTVGSTMRLIEQEFPETPALVYDGPFSEHITDSTPKLIDGKNEISESEAREIAARFTGISKSRLRLNGQSAGKLPSYRYGATLADGSELEVAVTIQGGEVYSMTCSRSPLGQKFTAEEALNTAKRWLETRGYKNMRESYYMVENDTLTANFAYVQDNVICYPDLIKASVAMDTGAICGFEAAGYLSSHAERDIPAVKVSMQQCKSQVSPLLRIESANLCLIPTAGQKEILCHEYVCHDENGQHYLVYVNAETGLQQNLLILLESENGTLTI